MRRAAIVVTVLTTAVGLGVTVAQASPAGQIARNSATQASHAGSTLNASQPSWFQAHHVAPTSAPGATAVKNAATGRSAPTGKVDPSVAQRRPAPNGTVRVTVAG